MRPELDCTLDLYAGCGAAPSNMVPLPPAETSPSVKCASSSPEFNVTSWAGALPVPSKAIPITRTSCNGPLPIVAFETPPVSAGPAANPSKVTLVASSGRLRARPRSWTVAVALILRVTGAHGLQSATSCSAPEEGAVYASEVAGCGSTVTVSGGVVTVPPGPTACSVYAVVAAGRTTSERRGPTLKVVVPSVTL